MKSNAKLMVILLITLGILFAFSHIITNNLRVISDNNNKSSDISEICNLDNKNVKISAVSGRIHIDNNWSAAKIAGICTGNGTYSEPYVIEDFVIDVGGVGSGILIENSEVYFRIENCTIYNAVGIWHAGIKLSYVNNSQLINNNFSSNYNGIRLEYSNRNSVLGNFMSNNGGILLAWSDNNTLSGNTVNKAGYYGIFIAGDFNVILENIVNSSKFSGIELEGDHNTVSGNTIKNNSIGIYLSDASNNIVSGNVLMGNEYCILEGSGCEDNIFSNNDCGQSQGIPGYNPFFVLSILSLVAVFMSRKFKKSQT